MPETPHDPVAELFASHNLRCTKQRRAIYEALSATAEHPTADDLYRRVHRRIDGISLATVYNTLEAFCRTGLAQRLAGSGKHHSARYDAGAQPHSHLRCVQSGEVRDLPMDLNRRMLDSIPTDVLEELARRTGFRASAVKVELVGEFE